MALSSSGAAFAKPQGKKGGKVNFSTLNIGALEAGAFTSVVQRPRFLAHLCSHLKVLTEVSDVICLQEVNATWAVEIATKLPDGLTPSCGDSARRRSLDGLARPGQPPPWQCLAKGRRSLGKASPRRGCGATPCRGQSSTREGMLSLPRGLPCDCWPMARAARRPWQGFAKGCQPLGQACQGLRVAWQSRPGTGWERTPRQGGGRMKGQGVRLPWACFKVLHFGCRCPHEGLRLQVGKTTSTAQT